MRFDNGRLRYRNHRNHQLRVKCLLRHHRLHQLHKFQKNHGMGLERLAQHQLLHHHRLQKDHQVHLLGLRVKCYPDFHHLLHHQRTNQRFHQDLEHRQHLDPQLYFLILHHKDQKDYLVLNRNYLPIEHLHLLRRHRHHRQSYMRETLGFFHLYFLVLMVLAKEMGS